jgi:hypothetical protein
VVSCSLPAYLCSGEGGARIHWTVGWYAPRCSVVLGRRKISCCHWKFNHDLWFVQMVAQPLYWLVVLAAIAAENLGPYVFFYFRYIIWLNSVFCTECFPFFKYCVQVVSNLHPDSVPEMFTQLEFYVSQELSPPLHHISSVYFCTMSVDICKHYFCQFFM